MSTIRQGTAECIRSFRTLSAALVAQDVVFRSMINTEALEDEQGRFRVWSGNLGALQKGHSSLDYRLRDSPLLQTNVLKLLNELGANLSEAFAVVSGDRLPYEQQPKPDESEDGDDVWSQDEDSGEDETPKTELEQRFLDIIDIVDNLYKLSVRIRSPTLRSRSLKAASYRPVDPDTGIDTFEQYALFDLQHTRELLSHLRSDSSNQKNEEDNYLIERLSKALTLRRRQFKYWRRHRDKLGTSSDIGDIRPQLLPEQQEVGTPADKSTVDRAVNVIKAPKSEWMPKSLLSGTEATQHHHSLDEAVDNQSVTSYATTTRDLTGRGIELPSPPKAATGERDFECPYCFIICPARYGKGRAWRTHILQDLQPYVCTYKDCKSSDQLFRSRREWSEHEAGHRKLWRCPEHINAVFRSSSSLEDHLHREHPGSFPEEQLSSIIRVGETSAIDLRQTCPICFVAATMEGGLQNHIANHLERLAVFVLPKDIDSIEDESDGASSAASHGRVVGSSASQHLMSESVSSTESSLLSSNVHWRSGDARYLDSDFASKISRLTSETRALGSETVPLKQEATNALSADFLTLLPDASNQKVDMFLLSSQQHSEVAIPESISSGPGNPIRDDHLELQKQSTNGPEDADRPSTLPLQKGEDFDNVLPELSELQADRQQTLPITFDSLAKDQHTENASGSGTDQEKFYYANELSDISDEIENAAQLGTNWKYGRCSIKIFKGHTNGVMCLQFNDKILATGSYDTTVKIWDIETGTELRTLKGHTACIRCLQFDDTRMLTGSIDQTVKVWNWRTGECTKTLTGHHSGITSLHCSGSILASGSMDHTIRIWDFQTQKTFALRGHTDRVNAVRIDLSSRTLCSASDDCTVRLWDLNTQLCLKVFEGHVGQVQQVLLLPLEFCLDENEPVHNTYYNQSDDASSGSKGQDLLYSGSNLNAKTIPLFPNDPSRPTPPQYMLTGSLDSTIRLWHIPTGRSIYTFFGHLKGIWALAADTLRVVSGAEDAMVKVWDPRTGIHERTFTDHTGPVTCVGLSDSKFASGSEDCQVRLYNFSPEPPI